ncbi:MAG: hypothetical protein HN976_18375, partial [Lentisphaerae bacterium]|nr:hypothetical protein [Lentisphaerota bacterium]
MSRTVTHTFRQPPGQVLEAFKERSRQNGIHFTGDERSGRASGRGFVMAYRVDGRTIAITVRKKPWLVPWSMVEDKLKGELSVCVHGANASANDTPTLPL